MKIEVGESLFLSWLRHVRGCRIVQLNWKPSDTWTDDNQSRSEALFKAGKELFESKGIDIFKQNASVAQLLRQGEIDALGLCENGDGRRIVAIDVAFHEAGLNYGGKQETAARVAKKVLRTVLVVETFFPNHSAEIIFAAPKINDAQFTAINNAMELLDTFLEVEEVSAECRVVANADFFGEIVTPVTDLAGAVADTSELFMRSVQLLAMAPNSERATRSPLSASDASATKQFASDLSSDGEVELEKTPIGKVVQREFERMLLGNLLSDDEIAKLCKSIRRRLSVYVTPRW